MLRKWLTKKNRSRFWLGVIVILCVYWGFEWGKSWERYKYVRVVDGDTIVVRNLRSNEEQRMRLVGIDAPDTKECYFAESTALLQKILDGRNLRYKILGKDGFGRILAIVYIENVDVSQIMVNAGAAYAYDAKDVHDSVKPDKGYFTYLQKIEEEPKNKKLGVWSEMCLK